MGSTLLLVVHSTASKIGPMNMDLYKIIHRGIESSHVHRLLAWKDEIF